MAPTHKYDRTRTFDRFLNSVMHRVEALKTSDRPAWERRFARMEIDDVLSWSVEDVVTLGYEKWVAEVVVALLRWNLTLDDGGNL
jgi:hypothetical protein